MRAFQLNESGHLPAHLSSGCKTVCPWVRGYCLPIWRTSIRVKDWFYNLAASSEVNPARLFWLLLRQK
jgi:hypothetical protein